jgi:hypothetical protein
MVLASSADDGDSGGATLPIRRLTLYKHGVGFVEREGGYAGDTLRLVFRAGEVNDVLKSLLVLDRRGGRVLGVDYSTPPDPAIQAAEAALAISADHALLDLLRGVRGTRVRLVIGDGTQRQEVEGRLLGVEVAEDEPTTRRALVTLWDEAVGGVAVYRLSELRAVVLRDERAAQDVRYVLDTARAEDVRRTITVRLSEGEHALLVSYLVPSPTWRVSYRLVAESEPAASGERQAGPVGGSGAGDAGGPGGTLLLQGWGLFDNRLDEDLRDVQVTLVAGQPISFVYDLATSRIPPRRTVEDEARVAAGPVEFERAAPKRRARSETEATYVAEMDAGSVAMAAPPAAAPGMMRQLAAFSRADVAHQPAAATGSELGELFEYRVTAPVSVGRGASALVPILSATLPYRRELLFNQQKLPAHPVAALRFTNASGLVLERGPVTVVEDGAYRGEALVPFTKAGSEVYLAFAVELGIAVQVTLASRVETAGLRIDRALLWTRRAVVSETTYALTNDLDVAALVTVEHPIQQRAELVDTRPPDAQTPDWYRWEVPCAPRETTTFVVAQRTLEWQQQQVLDVSYDVLRQFLERRWLDEPTLERIRGLLVERQAIARGEEEARELEGERERLYAREEQLRKNLAALSATGEEAALRRRVFEQLTASEARLGGIDERIEAIRVENGRRQERIEGALAQLQVPDTTTRAR